MILQGDALHIPLADASVNCVVCSPPYFGLRRYEGLPDAQLGLEPTPDAYVANLVAVFSEVRRVCRPDATVWVNIGDSYNAYNGNRGLSGSTLEGTDRPDSRPHLPKGYGLTAGRLKPKDLMMIPARVALALQADGWWLRSEITWCKTAPMPESVTDRPTCATEKVFLLTKAARYYYDGKAIAEPAQPPHRCGATSRANMDRVPREHNKQDAIAKGAYVGFNDRYDFENPSETRNARNWWVLGPDSFRQFSETYRWVRVPSDAVSDGMMHTVVRGCPVHDCRGCPDGEHVTDSLIRIDDNAHHRAPEQGTLRAGSSMYRALPLTGCNSHSQDHSNAPSAIDHSTESRRTGLVPETNRPCTSCDETIGRTEHNEARCGYSAPVDCIRGSSTLPVGSDGHPLAQTLCRTIDKSSLPIPPECLCSFYQKRTEKSSHFAVMPRELAKRCILAGCPSGGIVLDPFSGSGTTVYVAHGCGRRGIGLDLSAAYCQMAQARNGFF